MTLKNQYLVPLLALLYWAAPVQADQEVWCNPYSGPSYKLCRVDNMRDREVRLSRQLSKSPCIRGETWGRNKRGVWVDKGCRAVFTVSRGYGGGDHDDGYDDDDYAPPPPGWGSGRPPAWGYNPPPGWGEKPSRPSDYPQDDVPRFVIKKCTRHANDAARDWRGVRYVEFDRVRHIKHKRWGYRLKADYSVYFRHGARTERAVCDVTHDRQVTRFEFR